MPKAKATRIYKFDGANGNGLESTTKIVVAAKEHWARTLQVWSQWRKFKFNGYPDYEKLCTIFGQSVTIEVLHFASTQEPSTSEEERRLEQEVRRGLKFESGSGAPIDLDEMDISGSVPIEMSGVGPSRRR